MLFYTYRINVGILKIYNIIILCCLISVLRIVRLCWFLFSSLCLGIKTFYIFFFYRMQIFFYKLTSNDTALYRALFTK